MTEEQTPIQVTTKDPKKVEAGKKLAEYNRKKREELKNASKTPTLNTDESTPTKHSSMDNYVMGGAIGFGLVVYLAYYLYKKKDQKPMDVASPPQSSKIPVKIKPDKFEME